MANERRQTIAADVRVALLTNSLSPHTLPLCEGLSRSVRHFHAFVSAELDKFHGFPKPKASFSITVQRSFNLLRFRRRRAGYAITEHLHLPLDTYAQLRSYKPDVILSCQFGARTVLAILYRLTHPHARLILWAALSSHTESSRGRVREALRAWMLAHADGAFVNGRSGELYVRNLGFRGKVFPVPYTIDDSVFRVHRDQRQSGELRLLYCGRIDGSKGVLQFCRALHSWCSKHPEQRIAFQLVGDGHDSERVAALSTLANLRISVLPRMEQNDLAVHYHEADIFAFATLYDEWGVVVNEALAAGLPVLGSVYSESVVELVQDGVSGWVFDPHQETSVQAALERALTVLPQNLRRMSQAAVEAADQISPLLITARAVDAIAEVCELAPTARRSSRVATSTLLESAHQ